jgi:hypothetical protein
VLEVRFNVQTGFQPDALSFWVFPRPSGPLELSMLILYCINVLTKLLFGFIGVTFDVTDQLLIRFFCIRQILEGKWECNETVHQLFIDFKKPYDSVRREVLYNFLTEFLVPFKLVRMIKICLIKPVVKSV